MFRQSAFDDYGCFSETCGLASTAQKNGHVFHPFVILQALEVHTESSVCVFIGAQVASTMFYFCATASE